MKNFMIKVTHAVLAIALCAAAPWGIAMSGMPVSGVVLDEKSGEPIRGAIVYASWRGHSSAGLVDGQASCYHVASGISDAEGQFRLAAWSDGFSLRDMFITDKTVMVKAFKPGYIQNEQTDSTRSALLLIPRDNHTDADYFRYLAAVNRGSMCPGAGASAKNLYPLFVALVAEATRIASTKEERDILKGMRQMREVFSELARKQ